MEILPVLFSWFGALAAIGAAIFAAMQVTQAKKQAQTAQKQAEEASRQANAAERQAAIAEKVMEAQKMREGREAAINNATLAEVRRHLTDKINGMLRRNPDAKESTCLTTYNREIESLADFVKSVSLSDGSIRTSLLALLEEAHISIEFGAQQMVKYSDIHTRLKVLQRGVDRTLVAHSTN